MMAATSLLETDGAPAAIDDRDVRALTECMTVLPEGGAIYTVVGENGNGEHRVDAREDRCTCPDYQHREPAGGCKHRRRVAFATGERDIPAWVDDDAVDSLLGEHVDNDSQGTAPRGDGGGRVAAADGGVPEHLTTMTTIDGDEVYHCQTCGGEGGHPDNVEHHAGCPDGGERGQA